MNGKVAQFSFCLAVIERIRLTEVSHLMEIPQIIQTTISGVAIACAPHVLGKIYGRAKERIKPKNIEQERLDRISALLAFEIDKRGRLIVEQTFRSVFGNLYEYEEIVCILAGRSPLKAFSTIRFARQFVDFDSPKGVFKFKAAYKLKSKRQRLRRIYFATYLIFAYAALGPWSPSLQIHTSWPSAVCLLFFSAIFGLFAWASISLSTDISAAERFLVAAEPAAVTDETEGAPPERDSSIQHETTRADYSRDEQFHMRKSTDTLDTA
jgi:hypothetical protein